MAYSMPFRDGYWKMRGLMLCRALQERQPYVTAQSKFSILTRAVGGLAVRVGKAVEKNHAISQAWNDRYK